MKGRFRIGEKGAAAVEFAIILPLLVLIVFGTIEFSLMMFNKQVITNAAREGARAAIIWKSPRLNDDQVRAVVNQYCSQNLITFGEDSGPEIDICPDYESSTICPRNNGTETLPQRKDAASETPVYVTVTYKYDFLVLANLGFEQVHIKTVSVMKME